MNERLSKTRYLTDFFLNRRFWCKIAEIFLKTGNLTSKTTWAASISASVVAVLLSNGVLHGLPPGQEVLGGYKAREGLIFLPIPAGLPPVGVQLVDHVEDVALLEPDAQFGAWHSRPTLDCILFGIIVYMSLKKIDKWIYYVYLNILQDKKVMFSLMNIYLHAKINPFQSSKRHSYRKILMKKKCRWINRYLHDLRLLMFTKTIHYLVYTHL